MFRGIPFLLLLTTLLQGGETIKIKGRIVDGSNAENGQFPWHVLLKNNQSSKSICGGSLISSRWVLTAAKCLRFLSSVFLMFGTTSLYNPRALNMTSSSLYVYPTKEVGLVKLPFPVDFTDQIQAIGLPSPSLSDTAFTNRTAEICGFGVEGDKWVLQETHHLKYTDLRLVDIYECNQWNYKNYVCAKREGSKGSLCDGDMGASLVTTDASGKYLLIAIATETPQFCDWPVPLVYTRVAPILGWISDLTKIF